MNKELTSYVKIFNNVIPDSLSDASLESLKTVNFGKHEFVNYHENKISQVGDPETYSPHLDNSDVFFNRNCYKELMETVYTCLKKYFSDTVNFTWYNSWNGYTPIKFNKYQVGTQMINHCDHISDIFDGTIKGIPVLSIIGVLNNDYEGGELVLFEDVTYTLNKGDIIIFPSVFLYPHRITPITKGTRHSFVSWVF
jgi:hypothetical protein